MLAITRIYGDFSGFGWFFQEKTKPISRPSAGNPKQKQLCKTNPIIRIRVFAPSWLRIDRKLSKSYKNFQKTTLKYISRRGISEFFMVHLKKQTQSGRASRHPTVISAVLAISAVNEKTKPILLLPEYLPGSGETGLSAV